MGKLHFVGGEKGGVGKSFFSRLLAQYFIDSQTSFIGFDSDSSHSTFTRFYGEFATALNVDDDSSLDQLIDAAEENPEANIVVDLAAQTTAKLQNWMQNCDLFSIMQEMNYQVYFWHVMDDGADSMLVLQNLLNTLPQEAYQLVVVQNYGRGNTFVNFEESSTCTQARLQNARFIRLAKLQEGLAQKIDFKNFSFWAAANNKELMKTVDRHRIKTWLNFSYTQIRKTLEGNQDALTTEQQQQQQQQRQPNLTDVNDFPLSQNAHQ
ncbi:hypothetical protein TDB9533_03992 [Thalassocella blandensis]|nr:hypothetical protein TDB9533_03992 [Thalassocella blandensis]